MTRAILLLPFVLLAACHDEPAPAPPQTPGAERLPAPARSGTIDVVIVDGASGEPVPGVTAYALIDVDPNALARNAKQRYMSLGASDPLALVLEMGAPFPADDAGTVRMPRPEHWARVAVRHGEKSGEFAWTPAAAPPHRLELRVPRHLRVRTLAPGGEPEPYASLRVEFELDEQRAVGYPLGRTDENGELVSPEIEHKLSSYARQGETVVALWVYPAGQPTARVRIDVADFPRDVIAIPVPRTEPPK